MTAPTTRMACRTCGLILNALTVDDEIKWFHSRHWEHHDHEADPVPATSIKTRPVCDFCSSYRPRWVYVGADVSALAGLMRGDDPLGTQWAGCDECDPFVRRGDVEGLIAHVTEALVNSRADGTPPEEIAAGVEQWRTAYSVYLPSIHHRQLIPREKPIAPILPSRMPKIRDKLARLWTSELGLSGMSREVGTSPTSIVPGFVVGENIDDFQVATVPSMWRLDPGMVNRFCDRNARAVLLADLFWISDEFAMLATHTGRKLPEVSLTPDELPADHGLIVWQTPIEEVTIAQFTVQITALSWGLVPGGIWISLYCRPEQISPGHDPADLHETIGWLMPISTGTGIPFTEHIHADTERAERLMRTVLATFLLIREPGASEVVEERPPKRERRAAARAGRPDPVVRVVNLRKHAPAAAVDVDDKAEAGRTLTVRFWVEGHPYRQAYGPNWSLRRWRWRRGSMRGPAGAPLKIKTDPVPVVKTLR